MINPTSKSTPTNVHIEINSPLFSVKKGDMRFPELLSQTATKSTTYDIASALVNPLEKTSKLTGYYQEIGREWLRQRYWVFPLPRNRHEWEFLLVHENYVKLIN